MNDVFTIMTVKIIDLKAMQDVPEWLEEVASGAVGSNYGPQGGGFASRDTRVSNLNF